MCTEFLALKANKTVIYIYVLSLNTLEMSVLYTVHLYSILTFSFFLKPSGITQGCA